MIIKLKLNERQILKDLQHKINIALKNHLVTYNFKTVQEIADKYTVWEERLKGIQSKIKEKKDRKTFKRYINYRLILGEKAIISETGIKETIITIFITETKR